MPVKPLCSSWLTVLYDPLKLHYALIMAYFGSIAVQKFNVNHFYVKVLAKNEPALKFFAKHGFKQEGSVDAFGEIRMGLATDSLPRTELTIVKSAAH